MNGNRSYYLVIDADVIGAASESSHSMASTCRGYLQQILKKCHKAVVCRELWEEWRQHRNKWSRKWMVAMQARRKIVCHKPKNLEVNTSVLTKAEREAFEKDRHLVEGALAGDGIIVSCDRKMKRIIGKLVEHRKLPSLRCIDPVEDGDFL